MEFRPSAGLFRPDCTPDEARQLFKTNVDYVEIETFTYCNRKCWFCPNAAMPERQSKSGNQYMDESLYLRILGDLESVGYQGQIQFGRYNEPLADRIILKRIEQARAHCPAAWLYTHTNGDYLTREYLDELRDAGLSGMCLQTYLGNNDRYEEVAIVERQQKQLQRLGLAIAETYVDVPSVRHYYRTDYAGLEVRIDARNFDYIGTDRGGLIPSIAGIGVRTAPCLVPFYQMYIDWTGDTVPCCNLRSDRPEHKDYVVSRLQDGTSIFEAYAALHGWRKSLLRFGPKQAPCDTCNYEVHAVSADRAGELEVLYAQLVAEPK